MSDDREDITSATLDFTTFTEWRRVWRGDYSYVFRIRCSLFDETSDDNGCGRYTFHLSAVTSTGTPRASARVTLEKRDAHLVVFGDSTYRDSWNAGLIAQSIVHRCHLRLRSVADADGYRGQFEFDFGRLTVDVVDGLNFGLDTAPSPLLGTSKVYRKCFMNILHKAEQTPLVRIRQRQCSDAPFRPPAPSLTRSEVYKSCPRPLREFSSPLACTSSTYQRCCTTIDTKLCQRARWAVALERCVHRYTDRDLVFRAWHAWIAARPIFRRERQDAAATKLQALVRRFLVTSVASPVITEKRLFGVENRVPRRRLDLLDLARFGVADPGHSPRGLPAPWRSSVVQIPSPYFEPPRLSSNCVLKPISLLMSKHAAQERGHASVPKGVPLSPNDIADFAKGTSFVADGVPFNSRDANIIADVLASNKTLKKLFFFNGCLGNRGVKRILHSVCRNPDNCVDQITFGANNIGYGALDDVADMLLRSVPDTPDARDSNPEGTERPHRCFLRPTSLSFERNPRIGVVGAEVISPVISDPMSFLSSLNLDYCGLGDSGAAVLAASLFDNTALHSLSLCGNNITDRGATALSMPLGIVGDTSTSATQLRPLKSTHGLRRRQSAPHTRCCRLQTLLLSDNTIGDEGFAKLLDAIVGSTRPSTACSLFEADDNESNSGPAAAWGTIASTLQHLELTNNGIGDAGAYALSMALVAITCKNLQRVNLSGNCISEIGMRSLESVICAEILPANSRPSTTASRPDKRVHTPIELSGSRPSSRRSLHSRSKNREQAFLASPFADHVDSTNGWTWSSALQDLVLSGNPGAPCPAMNAIDYKLKNRTIPEAYSMLEEPVVALPNKSLFSPKKSGVSKWLAELPPALISKGRKFRKFPHSGDQ